ncbi:type VI secretion system baseplate subunit TssK [Schlesneria paludicola]|uniref:type VI secretion system baseplate subunit TssK n=1 Tax=Schlesneria paludicola TaxID=360056 RepID=UPI00029ACC0A|nr:type VI secretion system baseplate subunit TssK [Schlesneria paludicola]
MTNHAVHWSEGLFISPHHFQLAERRLREEMALAQQWHVGYAYGIRKIEIDHDALSNWRVSLSTLHIRLRDHTFLRFPEDSILAPLEIPRTAFRNSQERLMVHVAVPRLQLGRRNADAPSADVITRYTVESQDVEDENQAGNPVVTDVRWLNAKILLGDEELSGYETLPLMRLRLGSTAEAPPEIDPDYIPPLLACDAWTYLQERIIGNAADQLSSLADILARQMLDRGVAFESGHREDLERIFKLHSLNVALGYLQNLPAVRGIHPLTAYLEMCRTVGQISIFLPDRRMPNVPVYDHDDLGNCFRAIRKLLDLDGGAPAQAYVKRPFVGAGLQMQVRLEREWLSPGWTFYMGVESKLSFNDVDKLLTDRLDLKLGSSDLVENIYRGGRGGVKARPEAAAPRDFPGTGWTYWKLDRGSEAWQAVERTLNLAIRFNERQVMGDIDGEQTVQIRTDQGSLVALSFALYAKPQSP